MAHGGAPGQHGSIYTKKFTQMYLDVTQEKFTTMAPTTQEEMMGKSREAKQEEYLTCLILRQSSNARFSELKTKLANKVLVGSTNSNGIYPTTLNVMA